MKSTMAILLTAFLVLSAGMVLAQQHGGQHGGPQPAQSGQPGMMGGGQGGMMGGGQGGMMGGMQMPSLTPEQKTVSDALHKKYQPDLNALSAKCQADRAQVNALLQDKKATDDQIRKALAAMNKNQAAYEERRMDMLLEARAAGLPVSMNPHGMHHMGGMTPMGGHGAGPGGQAPPPAAN